MKNALLAIFAVFTATVLMGCHLFSGSADANFDKDSSYAYGLDMGSKLKDGMVSEAIRPIFNEFIKGFKDGLQGKKSRFSIDEAKVKIELAKAKVAVEKNAITKQKGISFLADNAKKPGIQTTRSGLQYEVLSEGKGKKPAETDNVKVTFEGRLIDGTSFESQQLVTMAVKDATPAWWQEAFTLMSEGGRYRFYVPYELGYGESGNNNLAVPVPPFSTLQFSVDLAEIVVQRRAAPVQTEEEYGSYNYGGWGY